MCPALADLSGHRRAQLEATGRAYCSRACSDAFRRLRSSETMAKTNQRHASKRMTECNPMHDAETRERMAASLRAIGHRPIQQGGNGKQKPLAEMILDALLVPLGFVAQHPIRTGLGYPRCYKPDCAHPTARIAVEADGASHSGKRREDDARRDAILAGLGWRTLRFKNETVVAHPEQIVSAVMRELEATR